MYVVLYAFAHNKKLQIVKRHQMAQAEIRYQALLKRHLISVLRENVRVRK